MENNQDFLIENGVLIKYNGPGGDVTIPEDITMVGWMSFQNCINVTGVTIPEGVTEIGPMAFSNCIKMTHVTIPDSVIQIGKSAFGSCYQLADVTIPKGVTEIGYGVFDGCSALTSITIPESVTLIGENAFSVCRKLISVTIPEGVTKISDGAFFCCESLADLAIPESVTQIGAGAFHGCKSLTGVTIPESVTEIGYGAFGDCTGLTRVDLPRSIRKIGLRRKGETLYGTMPEGLFRTESKLDTGFALQIRDVWLRQLTPEDWAWLYLYQTAGAFRELCGDFMKDDPEVYLSAILKLVSKNKKAALYVQAANFAVEHQKKLPPERIRALYEETAAKKNLRKAADLLSPLLSAKKEKATGPFAFLEDAFSETLLLKHYKEQKGDLERLDQVPLADGKPAPKLAVLAAVMPYADQYCKPSRANGHKRAQVQLLPESDRAAALLDRENLMELLWANAEDLNSLSWLLPYCRFANGKEIQALLSRRREWGDWYRYYKRGRNAQEFLDEYALMLSDTREAMLYLDKSRTLGGTLLDTYAQLRGTDAETLRDTVLAEFGLDEKGEKVYDLGGNTVTVALTRDLTLSLFDANAQKTVKSVPKKGTDPEKYEAAKADLSEMRKNVKKVVKARVDQLFQRFLSGAAKDGVAWQKSYLNNPVLRQVASLLVWSQGGKTFTLRDGAAIDSGERPYTVSDEPVKVAHPMEMKAEDVAAWQRYFNDYGIKQPFAQVWEPVLRRETVRKDRYSGIQLPAYRFKGKEKHGITFQFDYSFGNLDLSFRECELELDMDKVVGRHSLDLDGLFTLGMFTFKTYSRQVNHIVALLDQWTILGRIMKDDASVIAMLGSATLAQVMQYLNLAIENSKTNVTAELLNYKNERFPDFDPLAEFTLDDL